MISESMNIGSQGVEQDRSVDMLGFNNMQHDDGVGPAQTAFHTIGTDRGTIPMEQPSPLVNAVVQNSDTQRTPFPDLPASGGAYTDLGALERRTGPGRGPGVGGTSGPARGYPKGDQ